MPQFRFRKDGHFMGKYFTKGTEVELIERQAKYALLSGQLEWVNPPPPKALKKSTQGTPFFAKPTEPTKVVRDEQGEFAKGKKVGGTFSSDLKSTR